jgi:formate dehydrogenase major subunit
MLKAKEQNNAPLIVCDPRFTRTAAHASEYVRFRPGTDVALVWGILWHIFENGWEDKEFIRQRVWGMDQIREEVAKWTPEETERVTGVPGSQLARVAGRSPTTGPAPSSGAWAAPSTPTATTTRAPTACSARARQHGRAGGGTNIFRGHDNVQGATDLGVLNDTLPGYYGLAEGSWKHWARVWDVDYEYWLKGRFASGQELMESNGHPGVSAGSTACSRTRTTSTSPTTLRAMVFWGHAPNSQTRLPEMKKAMEKLDLLVVVDPYPTSRR